MDLNDALDAVGMTAEDGELVRTFSNHLETLRLYVEGGCEPGSCTRAILENDVFQAIRRADPNTRQVLGALVLFIAQKLPLDSYGSRAKVDAWIRAKHRELARNANA